MFTRAQYSARCTSSLCLKPYHKFCSGVLWEDLYADELVIIPELLEECVRRLLTWEEAMEEEGPRVNAGKTKIMICGVGLDLLQSSGEFPWAVSHWWAATASSALAASTRCTKNAVGSHLTKDPDYRCTWCKGTTRPLEGRPQDLTSWRW